jgi:hypothetical protein
MSRGGGTRPGAERGGRADEGKRAPGQGGLATDEGEFRETRRTAAEIGRVRGRRPDHLIPGAGARPGGVGQR